MNPFGFGKGPGKHERKDFNREAFRKGEAMKNKPWPKGRRRAPRDVGGKPRDDQEQA